MLRGPPCVNSSVWTKKRGKIFLQDSCPSVFPKRGIEIRAICQKISLVGPAHSRCGTPYSLYYFCYCFLTQKNTYYIPFSQIQITDFSREFITFFALQRFGYLKIVCQSIISGSRNRPYRTISTVRFDLVRESSCFCFNGSGLAKSGAVYF